MKQNQRKYIRRAITAGAAVTMLVPLLAACNTGNSNDPDNRKTLRIGTMYGSKQEEYYFRQQFTDLFEFSHGNIDIEVVPAIDYSEMQFQYNGREPMKQPDPFEKVKAIMTGSNPVDVMIFDYSILGQLADANLLKQLDTQLKDDKIDLNDFAPTVIDGIKEAGNGNMYALAPTFMPAALYYNKKMFSKLNVSPPQDNMTWDQVFNLAKQMTKGEGKNHQFGFSFNAWGGSDNYNDIQNFMAPLKLRMFDEKAEKMTVNSKGWIDVWKQLAGLYKDKVIPRQEDIVYDQPQEGKEGVYNPFQGQLFLNGKVAMTVGEYGLISQIQQMNDNADKLKIEKLDWDVVTVPSHAAAKGVGTNINLSSLAGINSKAANAEDAWEFVKFMNSDDWAKFKSRSTYEMPSRKAYIKPKEGLSYHIEAFTQLKPAPSPLTPKDQQLMNEKPNLRLIQELGNQAFSAVIRQKLTPEQALKEWETRGNDVLQKIKTNPKGDIDIYSNPIGGVDNGGGPIGKPMPMG